jgi:N-carbamoylputrescine amidase
MMKITVCELNNEPDDFARNWEMLASHVKVEKSGLVLLPEMTFYPWFGWKKEYDPSVWEEAVDAHEKWELRLQELAPATVLGTHPVNHDSKRLNEAFIWEEEADLQAAHSKYYLPNEEGFWESSWYDKGDKDFVAIQTDQALIGFVICTEIWFFEHSRTYGKEGVHLIACPRATPKSTLDKWLVAGRAAAVVSGAFCISSNRINLSGKGADLGGQGWIVGPDGDVLGQTTQKKPFLTVDIDLNKADQAKRTYPRYVPD